MQETEQYHVEAGPPRNTRAYLAELMGLLIEEPERREEISRRIHEVFGRENAVMCLDMSGFSRTTIRHGIVAFLLMIHQMKLLARPCLEEHGGRIVKAEADNLFALFDRVEDAVAAGREIARRLSAANLILPADRRLYVSIGIGYGLILNIEDQDLYGSEMNLASKLGEDLGRMGEILLTQNAHAQLRDAPFACREESLSISGMELTYWAVEG